MKEQESVTAEQIVARYLELREFKKTQTDAFKEKMRPYEDAMETLEQLAADLMRSTGQKALSCPSGTAYQAHGLSVICENMIVFHDWVFAHNSRQFLTAHVSKEAVKDYMDGPGEGRPPPGVKAQPTISVNFRKS